MKTFSRTHSGSCDSRSTGVTASSPPGSNPNRRSGPAEAKGNANSEVAPSLRVPGGTAGLKPRWDSLFSPFLGCVFFCLFGVCLRELWSLKAPRHHKDGCASSAGSPMCCTRASMWSTSLILQLSLFQVNIVERWIRLRGMPIFGISLACDAVQYSPATAYLRSLSFLTCTGPFHPAWTWVIY
jgi:hypothetical protein